MAYEYVDTKNVIKSPVVEIGKWLVGLEGVSDSGKTKHIIVCSNDTMDRLGEIKWYGAWRQYAFFPDSGTLYEKQCLVDISNFLKKLMEERKQK